MSSILCLLRLTLISVVWASSQNSQPVEDDLITQALSAHCEGDGLCKDSSITENIPLHLFFGLSGTGFHQSVVYSIKHPVPLSAAGAPLELVLLQSLPATIYANIYELNNAADIHKGPKVKLFGHIDVESIEALSSPTVLAVYVDIPKQVPLATVEVLIPLHGRYPRPRIPPDTSETWWQRRVQSPQVDVQLQPPIVLLNQKRGWERAFVKVVNNGNTNGTVIWSLPAGNERMREWSTGITAAIVVLAAGIVCKTLLPGAITGVESRRKRMTTRGRLKMSKSVQEQEEVELSGTVTARRLRPRRI